MKDLTLTQAYLLCLLNEKGKVPAMDVDGQVCLVAGGLVELWLDGCIEIDQKKVTALKALPADKEHLRTLYAYVSQSKPVSLEKVVEGFHYSVTNRLFNELLEGIGDSLNRAGQVALGQGGLMGDKKTYVPQKDAVNAVVGQVREELLEDGEMTQEVAALAALLERSGAMKTYFSKFELKQMKERLKAVMDAPAGKVIKEMADALESLITVMTSFIVLPH